MEATVDSLASSLLQRLDQAEGSRRVLVGLCGIPGSGKSQLGAHVVGRCNAEYRARRRRHDGASGSTTAEKDAAILVGMDGWHLTRAKLAQMDDPQLAKDRRGAAWTFDDEAFADFVTELRGSPAIVDRERTKSATLYAPSFDHAKKDPIERDIAIEPWHRIVVFEGLYANVDEGAWRRAAQAFDERWVVDCPEDVARQRLIVRHVATGVAADPDEAAWRADNNDLPNGRYLLSHVLEPARRIVSIDDDDFREEGKGG